MTKFSPLAVRLSQLNVVYYLIKRIGLIVNLILYSLLASAQINCPASGLFLDIMDACEGEDLLLETIQMTNMDSLDNGEADFGVTFVSFPGTSIPLDPYIGGDSITTVNNGDLTGGADGFYGASTTGGSDLIPDSYIICTILDPIPSDPSCRPTNCQQVNILSAPVVIFEAPSDVCEGAAVIVLDSGEPIGGIYSGVGVQDDGSGGFEFDPILAGVGIHTISFTFFNRDGCGATIMDDIEVFANPVATINDPEDGCTGGADAIFVGGPDSTGTFNSDATAGFTDNNDGTATLDVSTAGAGTFTVTYAFTDGNGCSDMVSNEISICESPCPDLGIFSGFTSSCEFEPINLIVDRLTLIDSLDNGEQNYGVLFNTFPGATPPANPYIGGDSLILVERGDIMGGADGFYNINTTVTNNLSSGIFTICATLNPLPGDPACRPFLCEQITIIAAPSVSFITPADLCDDDLPVALNSGDPLGGIYSGNGVQPDGLGGFEFSPILAGGGVHVISYEVFNRDGCMNTAIDTIVVFPLPDLSFTLPTTTCADTPAFGLNENPTGGTFSGNGIVDNNFDPAVAGVGVHTITYDFTDINDCSNTVSETIEVFALPIVNFSAPGDLCVDAGIQMNVTGGSPIGGIFSGPGIVNNGDSTYNFDPATAGVGIHMLNYSFSTSDSVGVLDNIGFGAVTTGVISDVTGTAIAAEDFVLSSNQDLITVEWTGFYSSTTTPPTDSFTIEIYTDGGGMPGMILGSFPIGNNVNRVDTGVDLFGLDVFTYHANISTFTATVGTTYWISIFNNSLGSDVWSWARRVGGGNSIGSLDQRNTWTLPLGGEFDFRLAASTVSCTNSATDTIEVFAQPVVSFTALPDLCVDGGIQMNISAGSPVGGSFSGPGVTDNGDGSYNFDPATAGVGMHSIEYAFTDENGCGDVAIDQVEVLSLPMISETHQDVSECAGAANGSIDLMIGGSGTFIFNWTTTNGSGLVNGMEDQNMLTAGNYMVTVINAVTLCSSSLSIELIDGVDLVEPVIDCPSDVIISCTDNSSVTSLGMATVSDNCDANPIINFTDNADFSGCGGTGQIIRTWTAIDNSNNQTICEQVISIIDSDAPVFGLNSNTVVVDCPQNIPVPITLTAIDECTGPITIMPVITTTDQVCINEFTRVYSYNFVDDCGNQTVFTQSYQVVTSPPTLLTSPPDRTVSCELDIFLTPHLVSVNSSCNGPLQVTGVLNGPFGEAGCSNTRYEAVYSWNDGCHMDSVVQIFTLENEGPEFVCPPDICIIDCFADNEMIQTQFDDYAELATVNTSCSSTAVTITNDFSGDNFINNNCGIGSTIAFPNAIEYQIVTFTATDACNRSTNCTALVVIVDGTPPEFNGTPLVGLANCGSDVQATYDNWVDLQISRLDANDVCGDNGTVDITYSPDSPIVSGNISATPVTFTASDACGNSRSITVSFIVENEGGPGFAEVPENETIMCSELPVVFGNVILSESCSPATLSFEDGFISGNVSSCDIPEASIFQRTWTATDASGNTATATQQITIIPNQAIVAGTILTEENEYVSDVNLAVYFNAGMIEEQVTTEDGGYEFDLPVQENYEITGSKNNDPLNGITTYDLVLLGQHLLQINTLDSPYKLVAADVNNSGSISVLDMIALRRMILVIDTAFQNNESWRFIDAEYLFPNPENPFLSTFPESHTINGLASDLIKDFIAVKTGDLNQSAEPNNFYTGDSREGRQPWTLEMRDKMIYQGQLYEIPITVQEDGTLNGFQFTLSSNSELVNMKSINPGNINGINADNFGTHALDKGWLTTSWHQPFPTRVSKGDTLFTISFTVKENVGLSELFFLNSSKTAAEMYINSEILMPRLIFTTSEKYKVHQNVPNPFSVTTNIGFEQPKAGIAKLSVFDANGNEIYSTEGNFEKGYQEFQIQKEYLNFSGLLFYRVEIGSYSKVRKMIFIK